MTTVYFAGTEDIDFIFENNWLVSTTANTFRSAYSRGGVMASNTNSAARSNPLFSSASFWFSARAGNSFPAGTTTGGIMWKMYDASGVVRLQMEATSGGTSAAWKVVKITAAGVKTTLFTGSFTWPASAASPFETIKIDVNVVYAVAGSISMYLQLGSTQTLFGSFTGDVTTDSATAIAQVAVCDNGSATSTRWSEVMVCDVDTRTFSLQTFPPVANGNTHNFDTGTPAAANVNEQTVNDATIDGSTTANQIDQYTQAAVATGTYSVVAVGISARALKGVTGPSKFDFVVRTGGADFLSADQTLDVFYKQFQNWWTQNPNTSADWTTSQIGSTAGFNIGIKSIT
jgi:hypothetical protein